MTGPVGYRAAAGQLGVSSTAPTSICGGCGVAAPPLSTKCEACGDNLAQTRRNVPAIGSLVWASVRATIHCRSCAFHSPLDGIEMDESVHCAQCGALQRFAPDGWVDVFRVAHAVAALGGPDPEGRFPSPHIWIGEANTYRDIGKTRTFERGGGGTGAAGALLPEVEIGRGHPVCQRCKQPLDVAMSAQGVCETRCRGCGATANYRIPPVVGQRIRPLRAIVSAEQRSDQRSARLQTQIGGGPVALLCPQCGGPLRDVTTGSVRCVHCNTHVFVSARARSRERGDIVAPEAFFLCFQGPSEERAKLEMPRAPTATSGLASAKGLLRRGLTPLAGVQLAPERKGTDFRQVGMTLLFAGAALAIGFVVVAVINNLR